MPGATCRPYDLSGNALEPWPRRASRHDPGVGRIGPALLFSALTLLFVVIAVAAFRADQWVIAVAAAALTLWMGPLAWSALRRMLR